MAIVLASTMSMIPMTTTEITLMAETIAPVMATNPSWKAFSVSVRVSAKEFLNSASISCDISRLGPAPKLDQIPSYFIRPRRSGFLEHFIEVIPSQEEGIFIDVSSCAPVNTFEHQFHFSRKDGASEE